MNAEIVISHKEPVTGCMYNPSFKQVITCAESSVSSEFGYFRMNTKMKYGINNFPQHLNIINFEILFTIDLYKI